MERQSSPSREGDQTYLMTQLSTNIVYCMKKPNNLNSQDLTLADWREANQHTIAAINEWVDTHGLPLRAHRLF